MSTKPGRTSAAGRALATSTFRLRRADGSVEGNRPGDAKGPRSKTWGVRGSGAKENRTPDLFHAMDSVLCPMCPYALTQLHSNTAGQGAQTAFVRAQVSITCCRELDRVIE